MFKMDAFERADFTPRIKRVLVEALADFFDEDEMPEWEVRSLSANELQRAVAAGASRKSIDSILQAIADGGDQVQALRKAVGMDKETPGEIVKRLEMLVAGSVNPAVTMPQAVKLAENFPIEFTVLTNAITELTGMGAELVKPKAASLETAS